MLLQLYPKNIFRFIWPVHVHLKMDKVDLKKKPLRNFFFLHFFPREFLAYFNALETYSELQSVFFFVKINSFSNVFDINRKVLPKQKFVDS
jgi:hypothetical protein